jgi:hypothetical protein
MRKISFLIVPMICCLSAWAQVVVDSPAGQAPGSELPRHGQRWTGVAGTITVIDNGKITLKTLDGQTAQVTTSEHTHFRKKQQAAKLSDFKVGDQIFVGGDSKDGVWQAEMVASRPPGRLGGDFGEDLGKRFIVGEVKAINGTRLTILHPDGVTQDITVDENTSFRKGKESITLGELKIGDHVFGPGEMKKDVFVPAVLNVGTPPFMGGLSKGAPETK